MSPGTVLDVGAAAGYILKGLHQCKWEGLGLEPNATVAAHARDQLGLQVTVGTLEDYRSDHTFKLVSMIQVIAHFYDIRQALKAAAQLTEPNGFWLIETWNRNSLVAKLLGQAWHEYSPPSVLHWFSPGTLNRFVQQFGFREIARGRPPKQLKGAHAKSLLKYKLGTSRPGQLASRLLDLVPDNLIIPYPNFDLFWGLYQKSDTTVV
jgi:hypothetical protein